jgi:hypothetical protein
MLTAQRDRPLSRTRTGMDPPGARTRSGRRISRPSLGRSGALRTLHALRTGWSLAGPVSVHHVYPGENPADRIFCRWARLTSKQPANPAPSARSGLTGTARPRTNTLRMAHVRSNLWEWRLTRFAPRTSRSEKATWSRSSHSFTPKWSGVDGADCFARASGSGHRPDMAPMRPVRFSRGESESGGSWAHETSRSNLSSRAATASS